MLVSHEEDEVLSSPLVTKEVVKQHLLAINNFKSAGLDNLLPRALQQLAEKLSGPLMLIFNKSWNTREDLDGWKHANAALICKRGKWDGLMNRLPCLPSIMGKIMGTLLRINQKRN